MLLALSTAASAQSTSPRAFSRAPDGTLWVAAIDYQNDSPVNPRVEKRDAAGAAVASVALPGAAGEGQWGFVFDTDGTAWLAGASQSGSGPRLTLWKIAASGSELLDAKVFDAGVVSMPGGLARDASGFFWISGVEAPSETLFRFALWKLASDGTLVEGFPVRHERGGGADGGVSVAAAPDGSVWSLGVSSDPATGRLDLGLWRFEGGALTTHHQPHAFLDLKGAMGGLRVRSDGSIWAAASKAHDSCPGTDFALLRLDLSGTLVSSSSWHADAGASMGAGLALDSSGALWAAGVAGDAPALWRFESSGALSQGYPKTATSFFEPTMLALDAQDRPWVVSGVEPRLFDAAQPVAGGDGPAACAGGPGTLAGTITGDFAEGASVTIAVQLDPFSHDTAAMQAFPASGGAVSYSFSLPGGASYYLLAFLGTDPEAITFATPIGAYGAWAPVYVDGGAAATADFALAADATPPLSRITSIADGASLGELAAVEGTAADGTAADFGELAVQDEAAGTWWDPPSQGWVAAVEPLYFRVQGQPFSGTPASFAWRVQAQPDLGGLVDHLSMDRRYRMYARVTDFSRNVEAAPSSVLFTWTAPSAVTAPQGVAGAAVSADAVSWTWSLVDGATGYAVYTDAGERLATVTAPPFLQEGLGPDAMTRVCVAASGLLGDSGPSCGDPATTWALAPGAPAAQRAEPERLEWLWDTAGNPSYTGYELQLSSDGFTQSSATFFTGSLSAGTSFIAGGLEPDRVYEARVRALNGAGLPTAWSASGSTRTLRAPPGAPGSLTATFDAAARLVRLSWTPGAGDSATYDVYRGLSASTETFSMLLVDLTATAAEDAVSQSGLHYYQVSARNADRLEGPRSDAASVLVDVDPPSAVADLRVWTREEPGQADLYWTAPEDTVTGVARYEVRHATWPLSALEFASGTEVPQSLVPKASGSSEALVVPVAAGETRYFALRAFDGAGNSSVSNPAVYDAVPPTITALNLEADSLLARPRRIAVSATDDATPVTFHFFVDGVLRSTAAGPTAEFFWDTRLEADGPHLFDVLARDAGGNEAYGSRSVMVSYAPPPAPSISMPGDGYVTKVATLTVSGWADPDAMGVQLQVDGLDLATATIVSGAWSIDPAALPYEGDVTLTAIAFESRGFSAPSAPVRVSYGQTAPGAPELVSAQVAAGGQVALSWTRGAGKAPSFYRVYRSTLDDLVPGEAPPVERRLAQVTGTSYTDAPQVQDLYFYGITAEDNAGNESPLSELVYAFTDAVAPTASVVTASGTTGAGLYPLTLTVSEPLARPPLLTFAPAQGSPAPVDLQAETALIWHGTVAVMAEMASGPAAFAFEATDLAGNLGTGAPQHEALNLDTLGPAGTLTLSRPSPLGAGQVTLSLRLDEPVPHSPALSWRGQPLTLAGWEDAWDATLEVTGTLGDGLALLAYEGEDRFGNRGALLSGTTAFVIDTVAPGEPVEVRANSQAGGFVFLSWSGPLGEAPSGYRIYRDGVFVTTAAPASDLTGLFLDHPAEGPHNYEVSSIDAAGNESARSDPPATADASPPAAPLGLVAGLNAFGQVELSWQPGDTDAVSFRLYRATQAFASVAGVPGRPAAAPFVESLDADGLYHWRVTGFDAVGNESAPSEEATLLYDKAAPVIVVAGVEEGAHYKTAVTPSFEARDGNLDAGSVQGLLDGQPFASGSEVSAEGAHALTVSASDTEGHAASRSVGFTLDFTAPALSLSGPAEGSVLKDPAAVTVSVSDPNLASTTVTVVNATLGTTAPYVSGTLLTRDGVYTVTARASDRAGNETVRTLSFRLDLPPAAPEGLSLVLSDAAALSWTQPEPDVAAYRVYRDGSRVSGSLHLGTSFDDPAPGSVYEVSAVDAEGQEGARARLTIPAATVSLPATTLTRGFFDKVALQSSVPLGDTSLELIVGTAAVATARDGVFSVPADLPATAIVKARMALAPGVTLLKQFKVTVVDPKEPILEVFADALLAGAEVPVHLRLYNRGTAALDVVTAELANSTSSAVDEVRVNLKTPEGTVLGLGRIRQTEGTATALLGGRQLFFVTVPPGGSALIGPVRLPVPNTAGDRLVVEAVVSTPTHNLPFGGLAGTRGFLSAGAQAVVAELPYVASVRPEREVYDQGSSVTISGMATDKNGTIVPFAAVQIHIVSNGFDRSLSAVSDIAGAFSAVFHPAGNEAGVYTVFGSHPAVTSHAPQSTFTIVGLGFGYSQYAANVAETSSFTFTTDVINSGATPIDGLRVEVDAEPGAGVSVVAGPLPEGLAAGARAALAVTVSAAQGASSATLSLRLVESHGFTRSLPLSVVVHPAQAIPSADPRQFLIGMLGGERRRQAITLTNKGFSAWRGVQLTAPGLAWARVEGPLALGDIAPGGNATFAVVFEPPSSLANGAYPQDPLIQVLSENAAPLPIQASIAVTSVREGEVLMSAIDGDKPLGAAGQGVPVPSAAATLVSLDVQGLSYRVSADANGLARFTRVPSGRYSWRFEAEGYQTVSGTAVIEPGMENKIEAVMPTATVTYEWSVTPTTIQDRYDVSLNLRFRTDVPAPVIIIDPPAMSVYMTGGQSGFAQISVTNKGSVSAFDVEVPVRSDGILTIEMGTTRIPELKPQQTVIIPMKLHLAQASCHGAMILPTYKYKCVAGTIVASPGPDIRISAGSTCGAPTDGGPRQSNVEGTGGFSLPANETYVPLVADAPPAKLCPGLKQSLPTRGLESAPEERANRPSTPEVPNSNNVACSGAVIGPLDAIFGLLFGSRYNSLATQDSPLGYGWAGSHFDGISFVDSKTLMLTDESGSEYIFRPTGEMNAPVNGSGPEFAKPVEFDEILTSGGGGLAINQASSNLVCRAQEPGKPCSQSIPRYLTKSRKDGSREAFTYYHYGDRYLPTAKADSSGNSITYSRDEQGRLLGAEDATGRKLTFSYNEAGRVTRVDDSAGRSVGFEYDVNGNRIAETDVAGDVTRYSYDGNHRMTEILYPNLGRRTFTYQEERISTMADDEDNNKLSFIYEGPTGTTVTVKDSLGRDTRYVLLEQSGLKRTSKVTDALGGVTSFRYDSDLQLKDVRDPAGGVTSFAYDSRGNATMVLGPDGKATRMDYYSDELSATSRLTNVTDPNGSATIFSYDGAGNLVQVRDALGNATTLDYGERGRVARVKDALGKSSSFGYDAKGALASATDPLGRTTTLTRDGLSRVTLARDPAGKETRFGYDAAGNMTEVRDALNGVTGFEYEPGRGGRVLKTVTDARSHATTFGYDLVGRVTSVKNALNQTKSFTYDANSNLVGVVDAKSQSFSFEYDTLNRPARKTTPEGAIDLAWDAVGNLTRVDNHNGASIAMIYDNLDRVAEVVQTLPGGFSATIGYAYDAAGNRTRMTTPWGSFSYAYDALNRLTSITNPQGRVFALGYDALGRRTKLTYPNGTETTYAWDAAGQLIQILHRKVSNNAALALANYTYDAAGNPVTIEDLNGVHTFGYDDLHRLTSASHPPGSRIEIKNEAFDYDAAGNRAACVRATGYTYDAANRVQEDSRYAYTFDANGNRTSRRDKATGETMTLHYDSENRLKQVDLPDGTRSNYLYDAAGRRVEKSTGTISSPRVTQFIYDGVQLLALLDGDNKVIALFTHAPGLAAPLSMSREMVEHFYHSDVLGSPVLLSDASGTPAERVEYEAYGRPTFVGVNGTTTSASVVGSPYVFTGYLNDPEASLQKPLWRDYDPGFGGFVELDPVSPENAVAGLGLGGRPLLNTFQYADGNPLAQRDPLGLMSEFALERRDMHLLDPRIVRETEAPFVWTGIVGLAALGGYSFYLSYFPLTETAGALGAGIASGRFGQLSDWIRIDLKGKSMIPAHLKTPGAKGIVLGCAIKGGGVNRRTGFSLPYHFHIHRYNWYRPWLWFKYTRPL